MTPDDRDGTPPLRRVLVATDFSESSAWAVARVGRLPLADRASVLLLHVLPRTLPRASAPAAIRYAERELENAAASLRKALARASPSIRTHLARGPAFPSIVQQERAQDAELVVVGRHGHRPVRDVFIGSTAEHVVRHGTAPVLVVNRNPTRPYRRPMVAVDPESTSFRAVRFVPRLIDPDITLLLVHAYDAPFEAAIFPTPTEAERKRYRETFRKQAMARLETLHHELDQLGARYRQLCGFGNPTEVITGLARREKADVIVLGTHARSGVAWALLGSVAADVLREADTDVLVVRPLRLRIEKV